METKEKLIMLYLHICHSANIINWLASHRMSNNNNPEFTDEEIMTIYLFGIEQKMREAKQIHQHIKDHWMDWFPKLPSYQAFNNRLNLLSPVFELLINSIIEDAHIQRCFYDISVLDSMPIIVAKNSRSSSAHTAREICTKGYCSSKDMYYYGLKLHLVGHKQIKKLPFPEYIWVTPAKENDLTAARPVLEKITNRFVVGDKAYADQPLNKETMKNQNTEIITPIKKKKKQEYRDAADELYNTAVSRIRQPIESFFNWLNEKTGIQNAAKVRSTKGLMVHVMARMVTALLILTLFNP